MRIVSLCFSKCYNDHEYMPLLDAQKAETYLGSPIVDTDIYVVRDVAPNKVTLAFSCLDVLLGS